MNENNTNELVDQAIEAVTNPPKNELVCNECSCNPFGESTAVERSLSELASGCNGTLGELLQGVVAISSRETTELKREAKYWRETWGYLVDRTQSLENQRCALVHELLKSREQTNTVRKNWSETAFTSQDFCDKLHRVSGVPTDDKAKFLDHIAWLKNQASGYAVLQDLIEEQFTLIRRAAGIEEAVPAFNRWATLAKHIEELRAKAEEPK